MPLSHEIKQKLMAAHLGAPSPTTPAEQCLPNSQEQLWRTREILPRLLEDAYVIGNLALAKEITPTVHLVRKGQADKSQPAPDPLLVGWPLTGMHVQSAEYNANIVPGISSPPPDIKHEQTSHQLARLVILGSASKRLYLADCEHITLPPPDPSRKPANLHASLRRAAQGNLSLARRSPLGPNNPLTLNMSTHPRQLTTVNAEAVEDGLVAFAVYHQLS